MGRRYPQVGRGTFSTPLNRLPIYYPTMLSVVATVTGWTEPGVLPLTTAFWWFSKQPTHGMDVRSKSNLEGRL